MNEITTYSQAANTGALALAFGFLIWMARYAITRVAPLLSNMNVQLQTSQAITEKLLESNSAAFHEVSQSNQNVAKALELLSKSVERYDETLEKHEQLSQYNFSVATNKLEQHTSSIADLSLAIAKHAASCDNRYGRAAQIQKEE